MQMTRKERANKAQKHEKYVNKKYSKEIQECINNTKIYTEKPILTNTATFENSINTLLPIDSVSAIFLSKEKKLNSKIAVLNFASWLKPGGMYLDGAIAQEEALCHESFLYSVLSSNKCQEGFYKPHNKTKRNYGIYSNDCIYSPDVIFFKNNKEIKADVITIAAPNKSYFLKSDPDNIELRAKLNIAMRERIDTIFAVAKENNAEILILGAFGCGVFHNNPRLVATYFKAFTKIKYKNYFKQVIFAIPNNYNGNYSTFETIFKRKE